MTTPSGPGGFDTGGRWGVSPDPLAGDTVAGMNGRTQSAVEAALKAQYRPGGGSIFAGTGAGPLADVWDGLRTGISLPLSILEALVNQLFGTNIHFNDMGTLLSAIEQVPGVGQLIQIIQQLTGVNLHTIFDGLDITNPGAIAAKIGEVIQDVVDALFNGLTGSIAQGVNIAAVPLAILGQVASVPAHVLELLLGSIAGLQAQMTALQNNPTGPSQTDDFSVVGVTGWTAITGALAVSTRGPYIQTPALMAAYAGTPSTARKPGTDKHGIQIVIDGKMKGSCRAWICGDTSMSNYAAVEVYSGFNGDTVRLLTGSSPTLVVPRKKVDFVASQLQNLNTFDIWYEPSANTFHVLRNGQSIGLDWVDAGNVVTHGSSKRNVGVVSNCTSRPDDGYWGPGIRKVTFYDR